MIPIGFIIFLIPYANYNTNETEKIYPLNIRPQNTY